MSQLVVCQSKDGMVLAADGRAVDFDTEGKLLHLNVDRLVQLNQWTAILTGGAAEGVEMCLALKSFLKDESLIDVQEVFKAALPFLGTEFERFMRKRCEILPVDPVHHVHFILAGYTGRDLQRPFRSYLLWTKKKLPQLDGDEISFAYAVPRIMGLEYTLNRLIREKAPLDRLLSEIKKNMGQLAKTQDEVGPPFIYAFITEKGFQKVS
jgi:hypothetical protein